MKTSTITRGHISTESDNETELLRKAKWRNLHFKKCGESMLGEVIYDTQKEAQRNCRDSVNRLMRNEFHFRSKDGKTLYSFEYSHTIQIPVLP